MAGHPTDGQGDRPPKPTGFRKALKGIFGRSKKAKREAATEIKPATLSPEEVRRMEELAEAQAGPSPRDSTESQAPGTNAPYDRSAQSTPDQLAAWNGFSAASMRPASGQANPPTQAAGSSAAAGPPPRAKPLHGGTPSKGAKRSR
ncbi:hypothetical protein GCM10009863_10120 [Streptomyces axinellae]|uniref:Uncharacterized protein n=1 Tax=Streptomyces axinellae TaxID=552788 RepID=A0ABN3PU28_9ACTN